MELQSIVAVAVPAVLALSWLLRLEGRLNSHEATCTERHRKLDERHAALNKQLDSIEQKLDWLVKSNGHQG